MLPVGCNAFDDWLLDALDVELLLEKIDQERKIDLTTICDPEHSRPAGRRTSGALLAAHLQETTESMGLMDAQGYSLPRLKVSLLSSQLEEQAQREIAYQIFLNSCPKASDNLLQSLRGQLEINEKRSDELKNIILKVMKNPNENLASLESHLKLLELISPSHFGSFRGYTTWRDGLASLIQLSLVDSVQNSWVQHQEDDMNAHYLISVMKGGFRRLDVKDADDFDERERKDAIAAVSSACREIAARCRNGMAIPWSLRASFAEVLLRGSFDSLDDGALIDEVEELDKILQTKVWPLLEISRDVHLALQVWANYRQFFISKEIHLLQRATQMAEKMSPIGGQSGPSALQIEVLAAIREECVRVLRDYRNLCESPEHVRGILLLLLATAKASVIEEDIPQLLSSCIQSSVTEAIERKSEYFSSRAASEQDQVALLATECLEILRSECEEYGPCLQQWIPNATAISAAALHEAYGGRVLPWIVTVTNLDKNAIAVLSTAMALEDELLMEMINHGMDAPEWGVIDRITPKLYEWTKSQIRMLEEWVMRIRVNEKWNSENKVRGMHGRSIGELLKATHDVVESLFLLGIPIPPGVVRCMVDGVDGILQKFCEDTVGFLGSVDDIVPPAPPLTRFKKDVVDAAEMADKREGSSAQVTSNIPEKSNSALKSITSKVGAVFTSSWLPPLTSEQKKMVMDITFDSLAIRANSLHRVAHCMGSMERTVVQKWESGQPKSSSAKGNLRNLEWASGMFTGVQSAAAKGADSLLHFAALKVHHMLLGINGRYLYLYHMFACSDSYTCVVCSSCVGTSEIKYLLICIDLMYTRAGFTLFCKMLTLYWEICVKYSTRSLLQDLQATSVKT